MKLKYDVYSGALFLAIRDGALPIGKLDGDFGWEPTPPNPSQARLIEIVKRVNAYEGLVAALRTARAVLIPAALFGDEATVDALRAVNGALKGTEE